LLKELASHGYGVQLKHDADPGTHENHGFISILSPTGEVIATSPDAQHNRKYHERVKILEKLVEEALRKLSAPASA